MSDLTMSDLTISDVRSLMLWESFFDTCSLAYTFQFDNSYSNGKKSAIVKSAIRDLMG